MDKIIIVPDQHGRNFFHKVFNVTDKPVIFLGDYTDPYRYEGFDDENCLENLKRTIEYKKSRPNDVTLLIGNHCESMIWSYMGYERTDRAYYNRFHKLYRDNIDLFEPFKVIKDTLFIHAGVSKAWIKQENKFLTEKNSKLTLTKDNVLNYIKSEYLHELEREFAINISGIYPDLISGIFNIGSARGGRGEGGPFWCDFYEEFENPDWNMWQVIGHQQALQTGCIRQKGQTFCLDSRAVFEYDLDTHEVTLSPLTYGYEKIKERLKSK